MARLHTEVNSQVLPDGASPGAPQGASLNALHPSCQGEQALSICTARLHPLADISSHFQFDEAIYTPYSFPLPSNSASSSSALPPASPGRPGSSLNPANNQAIGEVVPTETLVDIEGSGLGAEKPEEVRKKKRPRFAIESEASGDEGDGNGRGVPQERRVKAEVSGCAEEMLRLYVPRRLTTLRGTPDLHL